MSICYSDDRQPFTGSFNFRAADSTARYLEHYSNSLLLTVMVREARDFSEKKQALKELDIAERKMKFWERQENFDRARMVRGCQELKDQWKGRL
jgi:hypothetical protein